VWRTQGVVPRRGPGVCSLILGPLGRIEAPASGNRSHSIHLAAASGRFSPATVFYVARRPRARGPGATKTTGTVACRNLERSRWIEGDQIPSPRGLDQHPVPLVPDPYNTREPPVRQRLRPSYLYRRESPCDPQRAPRTRFGPESPVRQRRRSRTTTYLTSKSPGQRPRRRGLSDSRAQSPCDNATGPPHSPIRAQNRLCDNARPPRTLPFAARIRGRDNASGPATLLFAPNIALRRPADVSPQNRLCDNAPSAADDPQNRAPPNRAAPRTATSPTSALQRTHVPTPAPPN
jgi:hypothetical protein